MDQRDSRIIARPIGSQRQALVSYGDTHMVVGSPLIRDTVSRHAQPTDLLLAALATDCTFICQDEIQRRALPIHNATVSTRWNGPANTPGSDPEIIIRLAISGTDKTQAEQLVQAIQQNSQTYRWLARAIAISFEITCC